MVIIVCVVDPEWFSSDLDRSFPVIPDLDTPL